MNDTIKAKAYQEQSATDAEEKDQEIVLNDVSAGEKDKWYWIVRRGLAEWCGGKVQIEERILNPSPY